MAFRSLSRLARGLSRTRENLATTFRSVLGAEKIDEATLEDLEVALLSADLGPALTEEVLEAARKSARGGAAGLRKSVETVLMGALSDDPAELPARGKPHVVFVVGVNGGGKTTTVGKLAAQEKLDGRKAIVVAADTFRAAAIDQLQHWAERADVELIRQREGADPAAVVFDGLKAAKARDVDTVLVDTAGRLHTKTNLMAELSKLARVAGREVPGAPHEVLLVVDATTGQNGLTQAQEFTRATKLTGVVLTKLDGTAKGGVALEIQRKLGVPIRFVGVGEKTEDLLTFDPAAYVQGLLG